MAEQIATTVEELKAQHLIEPDRIVIDVSFDGGMTYIDLKGKVR